MARPPTSPALSRPRNTPASTGRRRWRPRLVAGAFTLLAAGILGWWFLAPQFRASRAWRAAREALDADDFTAARHALVLCQEVWPANAEVAFALARLERRGGDPRKAQDWLQEAGRRGWPPAQLEFEQTLHRVQGGKVQELAAGLRSAVNDDRFQASLAYEALVRGWLQVQNFTDAQGTCDAWVERFHDDWRAHYWSGRVLESRGYSAIGAEEYQIASNANPGNVHVRFRLAEALLNLSEFPRALAQLESCLAAKPGDADVRFSLARCLQALGRNQEAEALLQELVREYPTRGPALLLLARVRLSDEDPAGAAEFARRAAQLEPFNAVVAATLAEAYRGLQTDKEAAVWEEKARTLTDQNERVMALTRTVRNRPGDVEARYELGTLLRDMGRREEAAQCWRGGLVIDPKHQPTREALAALSANPSSPRTDVPPARGVTRPTSR